MNTPHPQYTDPAAPRAAQFRVSYRYISPGRAGPLKGKQVVDYRPVKGDEFPGLFGRAIVTAVSRVKGTT